MKRVESNQIVANVGRCRARQGESSGDDVSGQACACDGSGMIKAMATVLASHTPHALAAWLGQILAISSMPLSLVFTPDAFYFGVLPVPDGSPKEGSGRFPSRAGSQLRLPRWQLS